MQNDLLTITSVSRITGLSPQWLRHLDITGKLPANRTESGVRVWYRRDVEEFARRRELAATA